MTKQKQSSASGAAARDSGGGGGYDHAPAQTDARFASLHTDPRFLRPAAHTSKVQLDERFAHLLKPAATSTGKAAKQRVDKFGRKLTRSDEQEDLARLYTLEQPDASQRQQEEESDESGEEGGALDYARGEGLLESSEDESDEAEDDEQGDQDDDEAQADSSGDDYDGVLLGRADVRRKAKKLAKQREQADTLDEGSEEDEVDNDGRATIAAAANAGLDPKALRKVDQLSLANQRAQREAEEGAHGKATGDADNVPRADTKILRGDATRRLALVNLDWDHVKAIDLLMIFRSLVSPTSTRHATAAAVDGATETQHEGSSGRANRVNTMPIHGRVLNVRIYPSEFGQERMEKENREGPPREIFKQKGAVSGPSARKTGKIDKQRREEPGDREEDDDDEIWDVDEGGEFDEEMLRRYQLQRLRYYYAVATFSSAAVAQHVYDELDGSEMEKTANVFDCRFVPDDMDFPQHQGGVNGWRDEADENAPASVGSYKGVDFTTAALRHSKVKLTWDADDASRSKVTRAAQRELSKTELRDEDFKAYLASGSEDEKEREGGEVQGDEQAKARFRALMGLDQEEVSNGRRKGQTHEVFDDYRESNPEQGDMQITFMPGLSEAAARKASGGKTEQGEETTLEKYRRKQKEKKAKRRGELPKESEENDEKTAERAITFDDPFFAGGDEEEDFAAALAAEEGGRAEVANGRQKVKAKRARNAEADDNEEGERRKAELELMIDTDSDGGQGHFDMRDVLRAESGKDKKKRGRRGKRGKDKTEGDAAPRSDGKVQKDFDLDVKDSRFKDVFEDHRYALDPSHPSFIKTKAMDKLLKERGKRRQGGEEARVGVQIAEQPAQRSGNTQSSDVRDLVKGLKRRELENGENSRAGKKHKK